MLKEEGDGVGAGADAEAEGGTDCNTWQERENDCLGSISIEQRESQSVGALSGTLPCSVTEFAAAARL